MAALDMVRTSSFYKGGITGAIKIAHLAESHGMKAEVHGMRIANAHLAAAAPNNDFYEQLGLFDRSGLSRCVGLAVRPAAE
jgi:L-alanine-DL-glutamate epimerase-like enolase superfamily enzyme